MKAVYMMLSGLILSIGVTIAMAGLLSISSLVKSNTENNTRTQEQFIQTKDEHICQESLLDAVKGNATSTYQDCYAINDNRINYKERNSKKGQSN